MQHQLECALLGLGQFQNTLDELHAWLSHTADLLQASQPISTDLQTCEIELAKHKVQTQTLCYHWYVFICTFLPMLCPHFCSDFCSYRVKHYVLLTECCTDLLYPNQGVLECKNLTFWQCSLNVMNNSSFPEMF